MLNEYKKRKKIVTEIWSFENQVNGNALFSNRPIASFSVKIKIEMEIKSPNSIPVLCTVYVQIQSHKRL